MPLDNKPYKYLIVYPFNVLTICKIQLVILSILSFYAYEVERRRTGSGSVLVATFDILAIGTSLISLWFIVEKFFWRKLETGLDAFGIFTSIASIFANFVLTFEPFCLVTFTHTLTLATWIFAIFWTWRECFNNVSNLFIAEWGNGTEDVEIEQLDQHF
ncbi:unnamed protein product [Caenorhabditis angaria]|uniref:Uncharacterized protein n=1 Tax=Caenorhabditis angaria TaxID=860376 RepID=A0A9P1N4A6_9PELO|nr:unnamed protein product [Caenorhabditis angaria]